MLPAEMGEPLMTETAAWSNAAPSSRASRSRPRGKFRGARCT